MLPDLAPETPEEKLRVQKKWRIDCFAKSDWSVPANQGLLIEELHKLNVDVVVHTGVWTDACIVATAFGRVNADIDLVTVQDAVDTVTTGQQAALYVIQGAAGKISGTSDVLYFVDQLSGWHSAPEELVVKPEHDQPENALLDSCLQVRIPCLQARKKRLDHPMHGHFSFRGHYYVAW
eukprot:gnl/MRDRNA2_/MRDRNA2_58205_c0_seq1.p1 gnl/MRDRNA2_/MRDRNA2_58205_c0~~gnl/MRDRNA2_/MRDRNA2_58205_c0_seq1.p1  ORF type:complete len:178 (-),score=36.88 gnl/MRDRNA2_/MRDRNA2_58205_c0_seq1:475-1008(-)